MNNNLFSIMLKRAAVSVEGGGEFAAASVIGLCVANLQALESIREKAKKKKKKKEKEITTILIIRHKQEIRASHRLSCVTEGK